VAGSEFVEIGSHTFNHPDLKKINNRQASFEIVESKKEIEKIINKPVLSFCYPFGIYQGYDEELAASAGYLSSLTTQTGVRHYKEDLQSLKRVRPGERRAEIFSKWLQNLGKNMIN
jgi:peptidoglycan/xylan/chitin deacetylase (PgdA/CDA1 family)